MRAVNLCKTEFNIAEGAALAVSAHQVDQLYGLDSSRWRFFDTGSDTDEVDYCAVNSTTRDNHADEIHHMAVAAALSLIFGREPTESAEDRRHSPFGVLKPPTCSTGHLALCDDPGHPNDIVRRVMTALQENGFDTPDRGEPYFR
ncbi:hypothetical protein H8E07_18825, partial [bacterium]|nr:hypothetical protein [bacterium]